MTSEEPVLRDFIGYGEHPPIFEWPGGARVAVSLVINVEEGAERSVARGHRADDLGAHWVPGSRAAGVRKPTLESAFDYGARAGFWRLMRILDRHKVKATAFCCAVALQENPDIAAALVGRGHEIANHGYHWDTHAGLDIDDERRLIVSAGDAIAVATGMRPTSWYSRDGLNPGTRVTLAMEGFDYESNSFNDDLPHWGTDHDGIRLPVLPYAGDTNDSGLLSQFPTAEAFAQHLIGCLALQLDDPRPGPSVMSVGLHPRLIGRPAYAVALDRFLAYALGQGAWVATRLEIVRAWEERTREEATA